MANGKKVLLIDKNKNIGFPVTSAKAVYMEDGFTLLSDSILNILDAIKKINEKIKTLDEDSIISIINQMINDGNIASVDDVQALRTLLENVYTKEEVDNIILDLFNNPTQLNEYLSSKLSDNTLASGLALNDLIIKMTLLENKLVLSSPSNDGLMSSYQANKLEQMSVINIIDNLTTTTKGSVLDANQGKILNDKIEKINGKKVVENNPIENIVTLTEDNYQLTTLSADTTIKLPSEPSGPLDLVLEIKATSDVAITAPSIKYQNDTPSVVAGNIYELHLGYDGTDWIGGWIEYS